METNSTAIILTVKEKMTWEQYKASAFPTIECDHFGYLHLMRTELERWNKYNPQVFITDADPEHNYGLNFKVYLRYELHEERGLHMFKEISFGMHGINNFSFGRLHSIQFLASSEVIGEKVAELTGMDAHCIYLERRRYKRSNEARQYLAKMESTITTDF